MAHRCDDVGIGVPIGQVLKAIERADRSHERGLSRNPGSVAWELTQAIAEADGRPLRRPPAAAATGCDARHEPIPKSY